jgi:transcriptional regulator with GAF, ATPase, and Fis domain
MALVTWVHAFGGECISVLDQLAASLVAAGVVACPLRTERAEPFGVLLHRAVTPDLCSFLRSATESGLNRVVAVASAYEDLCGSGVWQLLAAGASDVFTWTDAEDCARRLASRFARWGEVDALVDSPLVRTNLIGDSRSWKATLRQLVEVGHFSDASTLLLGESGTGKEMAAQLVHAIDGRADKGKLVVLDCTTIVPDLSGSEFFGHERGAFTGAAASRDGAFALANKGTLFLDEVGELPVTLQGQLLRVIQEHSYKRVGGNTWYQTDFRLICATHRDLWSAVGTGTFRQDLYYRISSVTCRLPPLRERAEDIIPLARHFIRQLLPDPTLPEIDPAVRDYLLKRHYPGNIRELRQLVGRVLSRYCGDGPLTAGLIPGDERPLLGLELTDWRDASFEQAIRRAVLFGAGLKDISRVAEDLAVRLVVNDENGNLQRAARRLGVTDRALQMRRAQRLQHPIEAMVAENDVAEF